MTVGELEDGLVFQHAPHGIALLSADMILLQVNPALCEMLGYPGESLLGRDLRELGAADIARKATLYLRLAHGRGLEEGRCQTRIMHRDGSPVETRISITTLRDRAGEISRHIAQFVDIGEQQRQLTEIRKLGRHYRLLRAINQLIIHAADEGELYAGVCRLAVETGQIAMAWVGRVDSDGASIVPVTACGEGRDYVGEIRISSRADLPAGRGPCGQAVRTSKVVVCNDFQHDPATRPWQREREKYGWGSSISLPLLRTGECIGVLNLYTHESGAFDPELVALYRQLGEDISYALDRIGGERERDAYRRELQETRDRLSHIIDTSPAVIYRCQAWDRYPFTFISHHVSHLLGYEAEDFVRRPTLWVESIHPEDVDRILDNLPHFDGSDAHVQEYRIRHRQGHYLWLRDELTLIRDGRGAPLEIIGSMMEISDRKRDEEKIQRLTRFYHTLSQVNETIVRVDNEEDLLPRLCQLAVELSDLDAVWIGRPDDSRRVRVIASAGEGRELLEQVFISVDEQRVEGQGVVGKAWREDRVAMENHFDRLTDLPWYEQIMQLGLRSAAAFPVHRGGERHAVFVAYSRHEDVFDEEVGGLLQDMVADMSYALDRIDQDRRRREYEEQLQLYARVFEQGNEAITITDPDRRIIYVNKAFTDITGYSLDDVRGHDPSKLASGRHSQDFYRDMWERIHNEGHWEGEIWNRRKDGGIYPERLSIGSVRDDTGTLTNYVGIFTDISEQKAAEDKITRLAHYDQLTGLPNRILLEDLIRRVISGARRRDQPVAVLFMDLDRFKNVNDSLGHGIGDGLLQEVARRLVQVVRNVDVVARLGGDEFVVVLTDTDDEGAAHVAEKIGATIAEPMLIEGHQLNIATSIGISLYPDNGLDFQTLLRNADTAMYRAKRQAVTPFCFFTEEMQRRVMRQLELETQLRGVIERGELVVYYQPQVDLRTGAIIGAEALLRWQHPDWGLVSPGEFIPVAEESGLILPIGRWVLENAIVQNRRWQDEGLPAIGISVNLSLRQFQQADLVAQVRQLLQAHGLEPRWLELELTESIAMQDADEAVRITNALSELGIGLSIDDFGTGYSSLSYLKRFSLSRLKIDLSFIRDITTDPEDEAIVDTIISMAGSLGLKTIAEGVETREQRDLLRAKGCDEMQGYLFSRPLAAEAFAGLLRRSGSRADRGLSD